MGFDPVTLGVGALVAGTALSAYQQYQVGEYNADVAQFNAEQGKIAAGGEARRLVGEEVRTVGQARAIAGASGIAVDVGSNADVVDDIRRTFSEDIAAVLYAGDVGMFSGEMEASLAKAQAQQSITAGALNIGTTALLYNTRR